jgi:glycosyltransferase involved in cell wall biosynthesis
MNLLEQKMIETDNDNIEISVIVPICERHGDLKKLFDQYSSELQVVEKRFEFVFVIVGDFEEAIHDLAKMKRQEKNIRIIRLPRRFGESVDLMEGFGTAKGKKILTLASYIQIDPKEIKKVIDEYDKGIDLVVTRRHPRIDPMINRIQSRIFHYLVKKLTGTNFHDITSGMRFMNRDVLPKISIYGDLHRFIPIFAELKGIKIKEVAVQQSKEDKNVRVVRPGIYLRRVIDIFTLFFLVKFTKKPLRFFGLISSTMFMVGLFISVYLSIMKLLGKIGLSNRPMLLLGLLLMIFGIQIFSIGLVGELIIFSHSKEMVDYEVEEIIE